MLKKVAIGVGSFLGVVLIALIVVFVLLTRSAGTLPPPPTYAPASPAATPGPPLPPLAEQLKQLSDAIEQTKKTGVEQPVRVVILEDEANAQFGKMISAGLTYEGITVKSAKVYFVEGYARLDMQATWSGSSLLATMTATPAVSDGQVAFSIENASVGVLPLPPALREQIEEALNSQVSSATKSVRVTRVHVGDTYFTVYGTTRRA